MSNCTFKISKIEECNLKRIGSIPFEFRYGTCGTYTFDQREIVLLCFQYKALKSCHTFDGEIFEKVESDSNYNHENGRLGSYVGDPFIVGSHKYYHNKTEIMKNNIWTEAAEYSFSNE